MRQNYGARALLPPLVEGGVPAVCVGLISVALEVPGG